MNSQKTNVNIGCDDDSRPAAGKTKLPVLILFVVAAAPSLLSIPPLNQKTAAEENLPALSGEPAIEHPKQTGEYDSLAEAVKFASDKDTAESSPPEVDAMFAERQKLTANDGATRDHFGSGVAISGDTAIVGADHNLNLGGPGAAYIFVRTAAGAWTRQAKLVPSAGATVQRFGASVDIDGDTAIVGAYEETIGANSEQGAAYIFVRSGTTWTERQKLTASDGAANDTFGNSVTISGDTAIVGAPKVYVQTTPGAAYVFVRSGATWTQQQKLTASGGTNGNVFGVSIDISGDTAIIGAPDDDIGVNQNQGATYIFVRSGANWTQQQKLTANDGAGGDGFGFPVSVSGDTLAIGATGDDIGFNQDQGSAYVFVRSSGDVWTQQAKLTGSQGARGDYFAVGLAISGNTVIAGSDLCRPNNTVCFLTSGAAYVFARSGTTWSERQRLVPSDAATSRSFGINLALSGNTAIVGASFDDIGSNIDQGSAYIFQAVAARAPFDFDGDGKSDISVFRPSNGTWYLQRSSHGFAGVAFGQPGDVPTTGDYDGDGKTDIAVFRPPTGTWHLLQSRAGFTGIAFGQAGDIPAAADYDGDGKTDIAVFRPSAGAWYLRQSASGFTGTAFGAGGDIPVPALMP